MPRTEEFAYDLHDKVVIKDIQRPGRVSAMCVNPLGREYRVDYWADYKRQTEWVSESEIQLQ